MASAAVEHDARRGAGGTPGGAAPRPRRAAVRGGAFAAQERRGSTSKLTKILAAVAAGEAVATATVWRVNAVPMALKLLMAHTTWVTATVAAATCSGPRSVAWMGKRPDGSFSWWSYPLFAQVSVARDALRMCMPHRPASTPAVAPARIQARCLRACGALGTDVFCARTAVCPHSGTSSCRGTTSSSARCGAGATRSPSSPRWQRVGT